MGRSEEIKQSAGGNIGESMSARRSRVDPGVEGGTPPTSARRNGVARDKDAVRIEVGRVVRDESQPREEFDPEALEQLAASMKKLGQLQPVRVRWDEGRESYVMIAGERRWRAAKLAGIPTISAIIQDGELSSSERLTVQLVENCLRTDLKPIEQARAYKTLMDANGWSTRQVAEELSVSPGGISQALALLKLPPEIQEQVDQRLLSATNAYEVSKINDPEQQVAVAGQIVAGVIKREDLRQRQGSGGKGSGGTATLRRVAFTCGEDTVTVTGPSAAAGPRAIEAALLESLRQVRMKLDG